MTKNEQTQKAQGRTGRLSWAWLLDIGLERQDNQDSLTLQEIPWHDDGQALVVAVADGLGGGQGDGALASAAAVAIIAELAERWKAGALPANWDALHRELGSGAIEAGHRIRREASVRGEPPGATTLVAAVVAPDRLAHLYCGDSRLYHLEQDQVTYVTRDQTLAQVYLDVGRIRTEAEATERQRNTLFSVLGGPTGDGLSLEPEWVSHDGPNGPVSAPEENQPALRPLHPGDTLLLCSDGLWRALDRDRLAQAIRAHGSDVAGLRDTLFAIALDAGGPDNIALIVVRVEDQ